MLNSFVVFTSNSIQTFLLFFTKQSRVMFLEHTESQLEMLNTTRNSIVITVNSPLFSLSAVLEHVLATLRHNLGFTF